MLPATQSTSPTTGHKKSLAQCDFFALIKLSNLPNEEKTKKLGDLKRLAFLHFLNLDLPQLVGAHDLAELEKMTANPHSIDLENVMTYLRTKIPTINAILEEKLTHIKKEAIMHHYEVELTHLKLEQTTTGADYLVQILAVERLLSAIIRNDWEEVMTTVAYTNPQNNPR